MDLKEAKALIAWAQKRGIHSLKVADMEVTFRADFVPKKAAPKAAPVAHSADGIKTIPAPPPPPTLDEINAWIHANDTEAH